MKNLLITFALLISIPCFTKACSCIPTGYSLCESFENDTFIKLVALCKKVDTMAYGFKVQRLYNFYGEETRDTFWVWGDNGALCRLYDSWEIGDSIILSLNACDTAGNIFTNPDYPPNLESVEDYIVSGCGSYFADVAFGKVRGYIDRQLMQIMELNDFIASNCFNRNTGIENKNLQEAHFHLYPNPANKIVAIESSFLFNTINLYSIDGKKLYQYQVGRDIKKYELSIENISRGVYFIQLMAKDHSLAQKVIVE